MTEFLQRDLAPAVLSALEDMPVVVITGLRQTGKTTFLQKQSGLDQRHFVTFDDFAQLAAAKSDPDRFVSTEEPLTIDEAHKCPEIFPAIKKEVDRARRPGRFLLSGSANFSLLKSITESLAGRAVYFQLHPFSRREIATTLREEPFLKTFLENQRLPKAKKFPPVETKEILNGGMPTVCLGQVKDRSLWFKGYEQTYLERDIREVGRIDNVIAFGNFLRLTALRTGQILSISQLGRDAKLTSALASKYLSLFETSFVISRLSPYLRNKASRLIKSPKIYLNDSGLACYLCGINEFEVGSIEPLMGAMFETYVAQNLRNMIDAKWSGTRLHFWSVQGRHEVDFILEVGRNCVAIEIKAGARWQEKDLSGLKAFISTSPHCRAAILAYNGSHAVQLEERIWALPISLVLS